MTREIGSVVGVPPEVVLLSEGSDRLSRWEAEWLRVPARRPAYVREIALTVQDELTMLARSVTAFNDPMANVLRRLQQTPLAEVLFQDSRWLRQGKPVPLLWRARPVAIYGRACLWQRRGRHPGRVLVEEYFLAPLLARP